jgi:hopanoid C-2 methylase
MWERCIQAAYDPEFLFERFNYQCEHTFSKRIKLPLSSSRINIKNVLRGLTTLIYLFWYAGVTGTYRHAFWKMAISMLKSGKIEQLLTVGLLAHHLIEYTRECSGGTGFASFYSQRNILHVNHKN